MNKLTQDLILKSSFVIFFKCVGALSLFGLNWLVANALSKDHAGSFFWYLSFFQVLLHVCLLGLPDTVLKFVANLNGDKEIGKSKWVVLYALKKTIQVGMVISSGCLVYYFVSLNQLFGIEPNFYFFLVSWATLFQAGACLLYTSPSPRDQRGSRMPSSA